MLHTRNASVRLAYVVEPERGQVEHLSSSHCAVQRLGQSVGGVLLQVWLQGVQGDPGDLRTNMLLDME